MIRKCLLVLVVSICSGCAVPTIVVTVQVPNDVSLKHMYIKK